VLSGARRVLARRALRGSPGGGGASAEAPRARAIVTLTPIIGVNVTMAAIVTLTPYMGVNVTIARETGASAEARPQFGPSPSMPASVSGLVVGRVTSG
jgi:hypothetical protein